MKNLIIEMVENNEVKQELYKALQGGAKIMYSTNWRSTPISEYNSDKLNIKVNPTVKDEEYFDKKIDTMAEIVADKKNWYKIKLEKMPTTEKRIKAVQSLTSQYESADILEYIMN